ncbi:ATP-dependent DNA helicase DDX31 [Plasmodium brasilianum]|uniref:ATP-dependent RNA helicase n=2 Tax=Plasmodium (Plasmodium) TaxID=418103 RepID=A0A1A8WL45_PLAMA|nr:ATP-dependent RNA helicase DBP7, putative [Plasmodium malariae]KAI4840755.1 ATP-dependent DNA helicase DDX31 [Plasmodium brasilianum]SBS93662.1 DEAD/DEAH box ATP-dependent RNA helicase, putative [Plasmodium malariae]SBT86321.1 ATP-dependent RNA helicase DBP7, putative [Plasmodium malariae]
MKKLKEKKKFSKKDILKGNSEKIKTFLKSKKKKKIKGLKEKLFSKNASKDRAGITKKKDNNRRGKEWKTKKKEKEKVKRGKEQQNRDEDKNILCEFLENDGKGGCVTNNNLHDLFIKKKKIKEGSKSAINCKNVSDPVTHLDYSNENCNVKKSALENGEDRKSDKDVSEMNLVKYHNRGTKISNSTNNNNNNNSSSSSYSSSIFEGLFSDLREVLSECLIKTLEKNNFTKTTSIQRTSIPLMFKENDVFLKCMTGSGKTLCYAIPAVQKILNMKEKNIKITRDMGTFILILSPTRELAVQINSLFYVLTKPYPYIVVSCITGGEKKKSEKNRLRKGISILTCTPGRLLDHLEHTKSLKLTYLKSVILDEADKIIYLGTQDKIKLIYDMIKKLKHEEIVCMQEEVKNYDQVRKNFQMIFISATLNRAIKSLANYCLTNKTLWVEKKSVTRASFSAYGADLESGNAQGNASENMADSSADNAADNSAQNDDGNTNFITGSYPQSENFGSYELPEQLRQHCILLDMKQKFWCLLCMLLECVEKKMKPVVFLSNHNSVEYFQILLKNIYWPTDVKKKNIEVNKRLNKEIKPVLEKEDELLLKKHLENCVLNKYKEVKRDDFKLLPYKNLIVDDIYGGCGDEQDRYHAYIDNDDEGEQILYNINTDKHKRVYLFKNVPIYILHGNLSKEDRLGNFNDFSKNANGILLCTDIASRGLNFNSLDVVIQYDIPQVLEEYIHKVGRTARLNKEGFSYLFLLYQEKEFINILKNKNIVLKEIKGNELINKIKKEYIPSFLKSVGGNVLEFLQNHFQSIVKSNNTLIEKSTSAYLCSVTSYYSVSKNLRTVFNAKNLHLGHLAYTFMLDQTPKEISRFNKKHNYLKVKKHTVLSNKDKRFLRSKGFKKKKA